MLTEREKTTQKNFNARPEEFLKHAGGENRNFWALEMKEFVSLLKGRKVIEVGCGPATDGKHLLNYGLDCISMDYAKNMLLFAKKLNPSLTLFQMDLYNLAFKENSFDGFWATACLLHLEHPENALVELARITKTKGVGFISMVENQGEIVDSQTNYYFKYTNDQDFRKLLAKSGLSVVTADRKNNSSSKGDWLTYIVRKNI
jgi:ubiquinone/menaquinone biosynthesis C-methylase UbiE